MRLAFAFFGIAIVSVIAVAAFQAALATAGDRAVVRGETFTPTTGSAISLDRSNLDNAYYNGTVDVEDENGDQSFNGTDYIWYQQNGTIEPLAGGNLDGDTSATIDYSYRRTTERQRTLAGLLATIPKTSSILPVLGIALIAFAALRGVL